MFSHVDLCTSFWKEETQEGMGRETKGEKGRDICRGSGTLEQMNTSTGREAT